MWVLLLVLLAECLPKAERDLLLVLLLLMALLFTINSWYVCCVATWICCWICC